MRRPTLLLPLALVLLASCNKQQPAKPTANTQTQNVFTDTILVANRPEYKPTAFVDPKVINPWGIALRPPGAGGHIWLSNAGNATTTTYIGDANGKPLIQDGLKVVTIDGPLISFEDGLTNVTGQVYNAASDFPGQPVEFPVQGPASDLTSGTPVSIGTSSGPTKFVFVTTDGTINAWRAKTAESMNSAIIVKDFSQKGKDQDTTLRYLPAYTGCALTTDPAIKDSNGTLTADNRLYVTDFQNSRIQTFNNKWEEITARVPFPRPIGIPDDYSPYNIQWLGDKLCVVYAALDLSADEPAVDAPGKGIGHVAFYDRDGHLLSEMKDTGLLNSPWGVVIAPANWGPFGGDLLVANFGDGTIAAFNPTTGDFHDYLRTADGKPIVVDGVWGLTFGNGVSLGDLDSLYYTAGPNNEQDGTFGRLRHTPQ